MFHSPAQSLLPPLHRAVGDSCSDCFFILLTYRCCILCSSPPYWWIYWSPCSQSVCFMEQFLQEFGLWDTWPYDLITGRSWIFPSLSAVVSTFSISATQLSSYACNYCHCPELLRRICLVLGPHLDFLWTRLPQTESQLCFFCLYYLCVCMTREPLTI